MQTSPYVMPELRKLPPFPHRCVSCRVSCIVVPGVRFAGPALPARSRQSPPDGSRPTRASLGRRPRSTPPRGRCRGRSPAGRPSIRAKFAPPRSVSATARTPDVVNAPDSVLGDHQMPFGERVPPVAGGSRPAPDATGPAGPDGDRSRTAAWPPTPASTSSKTSVGGPPEPAKTTSIASITRDSSPPDAPFCRGRAGAPGCATRRSSTSSAPSGPMPHSTPPTASDGSPRPTGRGATTLDVGVLAWPETVAPRSRLRANRSRPRPGVSGRLSVASAATSSASRARSRVEFVEQLIGAVHIGPVAAGALVGPGDDAVDVLGVFTGERPQRGPPFVDLLEAVPDRASRLARYAPSSAVMSRPGQRPR